MGLELQNTRNSGTCSLLTTEGTGQTHLPCPSTFASAQEAAAWSYTTTSNQRGTHGRVWAKCYGEAEPARSGTGTGSRVAEGTKSHPRFLQRLAMGSCHHLLPNLHCRHSLKAANPTTRWNSPQEACEQPLNPRTSPKPPYVSFGPG